MLIEVLNQNSSGCSYCFDLNYIGSITVDEDLIDAAGLVVGESLHRKCK